MAPGHSGGAGEQEEVKVPNSFVEGYGVDAFRHHHPLQSPDGPLSTALSLFPPLTPLLMFLRITVLTPPWWQIALSIALMVLAIAGVVWLAARVHRVGILMYGKRPTFPELMRWAARH